MLNEDFISAYTFTNNRKHNLALIKELRLHYHSVHGEEREKVVEFLADQANSEAKRELIDLFFECQWRSTKLQIISQLYKNINSRSIEFLCTLALNEKDLPICEAAILSLGRSKNRMAGRFLVNMYQEGPEILKPIVVRAIGLVPEHSIVEKLIQDIKPAVENNNLILLKNILITLAELKEPLALPELIRLAKMKNNREVALSAILALGKLSRSVEDLKNLEVNFAIDPLDLQIYETVCQQIRFRTQWRLEDYLHRMFEVEHYHDMLPMELNSFNIEDVASGLSIFNENKYTKRLAIALGCVHHTEIISYYAKFFAGKLYSDEELIAVFQSVQNHSATELQLVIEDMREQVFASPNDDVFQEWCHCLVFSLPNADEVFSSFCKSNLYTKLPVKRKILLCNSLSALALVFAGNAAKTKAIYKILDAFFEIESDAGVISRVIRCFAQVKHCSTKVFNFIKNNFNNSDYVNSIYFLLECCPSKAAGDILLANVPTVWDKNTENYIKALAAQKNIEIKSDELCQILQKMLTSTDSNSKWQALRLLTHHPIKGMFDLVLQKVSSRDESVALAAIIALKSFADEKCTRVLAENLNSVSESIAGRSLDALLEFSTPQAFENIFNYIDNNIEDAEICHKIARCLKPGKHDYTLVQKKLKLLLEKYATHNNYNAILNIQEKLETSVLSNKLSSKMINADNMAIDAKLAIFFPGYSTYDDIVKSAIRAAEIPYENPSFFKGDIDKSVTILQYYKATDLFIEHWYGNKYLFPLLEKKLSQFQNVLHLLGLNDVNVDADNLLKALGLQKDFVRSNLPISKMLQIAKGILNGKILYEQWKIIDGLKAWAALFLLFSRDLPSYEPTGKPLPATCKIKPISHADLILLTKKLTALQDLRNPAAHRQTVVQFSELDFARQITIQVFGILERCL